MTNAVGWDELFGGHMILAVYNMLDTAFGSQGWPITGLILVTQLMLYWKSKSLMLVLVLGTMFTSMFMLQGFFHDSAKGFMYILLVFYITGILYKLIRK